MPFSAWFFRIAKSELYQSFRDQKAQRTVSIDKVVLKQVIEEWTEDYTEQDKARLLETAPELVRGMRIDANETMTPGSVRLFANDAIVEDLVTQRLHALVQGLHLDDQAWQSHSLLQQPQWSAPKDMQSTHASPQAPAIADSSESDDVHP